MIPIKRGTATRLGLRKPTGAYRYRDGTVTWPDDMLPWIEAQLGVKTEPFQRVWLNEMARWRHGRPE